MNNTFDVNRFKSLFIKSITERPLQIWGVMGLALGGMLLLYTTFSSSGEGTMAGQHISFLLGFAGGGSFLASFVFGYFANKSTGASYLTLPASHFEKWLCGVIIILVIFPLVFIPVFKLVDTAFVTWYLQHSDPAHRVLPGDFNYPRYFSLTEDLAPIAYIVFANLSGVVVLGSLYFNKAAIVKVAITVGIFMISLVLLNVYVAKALIPFTESAIPFTSVWVNNGKSGADISLPESIARFFLFCIRYVTPGIFWLLALLRLKEKEF